MLKLTSSIRSGARTSEHARPEQEEEEASNAKRPRSSDLLSESRVGRRSEDDIRAFWSSWELVLAAKLLNEPTAKRISFSFEDSEQMRRVFMLVYDVLRYKSILQRALADIAFFIHHPELESRKYLVWLVFFDLYKREFAQREQLEPWVAEHFKSTGLAAVDRAIWECRVKLAATVSRLRIKHAAHNVAQLLPPHLREARVSVDDAVITAWVNHFITDMGDVTCKLHEELGISALPIESSRLTSMTYKKDHLVPRFLSIQPASREDLVKSLLVKDHHIIMQDRSYCIASAVTAHLMTTLLLTGSVAQTHSSSVQSIAYLANLLVTNTKVDSLLVFSAGERKEEYERYLGELGVSNTQVFAEKFSSLAPDSPMLDNVIGVLATPPNSESSAVDPVDLAVSRGGDVSLLERLTQDEPDMAVGNIENMLIEQRNTLRYAMSKPQIQFVVYETHSGCDMENSKMVTQLISELNTWATERHAEESQHQYGESMDVIGEDGQPIPRVGQEETPVIGPSVTSAVQVPLCDLFETAPLPDLCPHSDSCLKPEEEGIYVAIIKRKEITRLGPKYMIQMAEQRGLFGRSESEVSKKAASKAAKKKAALARMRSQSGSLSDSKKSRSSKSKKGEDKVLTCFTKPSSIKEQEEIIQRLVVPTISSINKNVLFSPYRQAENQRLLLPWRAGMKVSSGHYDHLMDDSEPPWTRVRSCQDVTVSANICPRCSARSKNVPAKQWKRSRGVSSCFSKPSSIKEQEKLIQRLVVPTISSNNKNVFYSPYRQGCVSDLPLKCWNQPPYVIERYIERISLSTRPSKILTQDSNKSPTSMLSSGKPFYKEKESVKLNNVIIQMTQGEK